MVGIIVFCGIGPESKVDLKTNAFEKEFSKERNLAIMGIMRYSPMHKGMLGWSQSIPQRNW